MATLNTTIYREVRVSAAELQALVEANFKVGVIPESARLVVEVDPLSPGNVKAIAFHWKEHS
jgi:hypothetical protein